MNLAITGPLADTQATRFYRILEGQIVSGELPPGHELSERSISEQLKIGRTPVREALQKLAANHLVQVEPRRGTFVSPIKAESSAELFYVAWPLERLIMLRAAERGRAEELKRLGELAAGMAAGDAKGKPAPLYFEINELIAKAAQNPYLAAVLAPMGMLVERVRIVCGLAEDAELLDAFARLIGRIAAGDAQGVGSAFEPYADIFERKAMAYLETAG